MPPHPAAMMLAFYVPAEKWIIRHRDETWDFANPIGKKGAMFHLISQGIPADAANEFLNNPQLQIGVYGQDMRPGLPPIYVDEMGRHMVNLFRPPDIHPEPGDFPTIQANVEWITDGDPEAIRYVHHFFARKYQNPGLCPKVAIAISTLPGGGKGFVYCVQSQLHGPANCSILKQSDLESQFTGRFGNKLLNLGDEVLSGDNVRDNSQTLKIYIDGSEIGYERKYENAVTIKNRSAWIFASNSQVTPLHLEDSDRRYTFFSNFKPVPPEYTAKMNACFESDRTTITAAFKKEIAAYGYYLKHLEVDVAFVSKPYRNDARTQLIDAGRPGHEVFFREVEENGWDSVFEDVDQRGYVSSLNGQAKDWDFGENGVATSIIYQVYRSFCKQNGFQYLRNNKFGAAMKNHLPTWPHRRNTIPGSNPTKQVWCYGVPRRK